MQNIQTIGFGRFTGTPEPVSFYIMNDDDIEYNCGLQSENNIVVDSTIKITVLNIFVMDTLSKLYR